MVAKFLGLANITGSGYAWEDFFFFFYVESEKELWFCEMWKWKNRMARESSRALIPCRKPKSNGDINGD